MHTTRPGISKYFIAIVPPSPVLEQAWKWKEHFKTQFDSRAALNSPPHITLHMPFEWKSEKEEKLIEKLHAFSQTQSAFHLELKNFGCFPPHVIFIQVEPSQALTGLQSSLERFCKTELNLFNANRFDKPFHPHLTVAFRDLKKSVFPSAWGSVKELNFAEVCAIENFSLLQHNGKAWHVKKSFRLAG
jgi:2'-5' RNA ligase